MGLVYSEITLSNPVKPSVNSLPVKCLADTGATFLAIPENIASQLQLETLEMRNATIADGSVKPVPYVGPVKVSFNERSCYTGALVLGNEVLLGAVPMQDMDLVVMPKFHSIAVNPDSPNIPRAIMK